MMCIVITCGYKYLSSVECQYIISVGQLNRTYQWMLKTLFGVSFKFCCAMLTRLVFVICHVAPSVIQRPLWMPPTDCNTIGMV